MDQIATELLKIAKSLTGSSGDCYEVAAQYIIEHALFPGDKKSLWLVHGEVAGQEPLEGTNFGHAWVLDGNKVIDNSSGGSVIMPKKQYYEMGKIDEINNVHVYNPEQARRMLLKYKTYGPWELQTSTGL